MFKLVRVDGQSMAPSINHGDYVLLWRGFASLKVRYKPGDCVLATHPQYKVLVKRVARLCAERGVLLQGDNPESISPLTMGWLAPDRIIGRVVWAFKSRS